MISVVARPDNSRELNGVASVEQECNQCDQEGDNESGKKNIDIVVHVGIGHNRHCISWRWDWIVHTRAEEKKHLHQASNCNCGGYAKREYWSW